MLGVFGKINTMLLTRRLHSKMVSYYVLEQVMILKAILGGIEWINQVKVFLQM
jgi:hypothetical protein